MLSPSEGRQPSSTRRDGAQAVCKVKLSNLSYTGLVERRTALTRGCKRCLVRASQPPMKIRPITS